MNDYQVDAFSVHRLQAGQLMIWLVKAIALCASKYFTKTELINWTGSVRSIWIRTGRSSIVDSKDLRTKKTESDERSFCLL